MNPARGEKFTKVGKKTDVEKPSHGFRQLATTEEQSNRKIKDESTLRLVPGAMVTDEESLVFATVIAEGWDASRIESMPEETLSLFRKRFLRGAGVLAERHRDVFIEKLWPIISEPNRNKLWQINHRRILISIDTLTRHQGRFPSRSEIAKECCLSMVTVNKHLKEYYGSDEQLGKRHEFAVLRENVLATVYTHAQGGDMKAARCFLDATDQFAPAAITPRTQNNFIQINGLTVTQEQIKFLSEDKLREMQKILALVPSVQTHADEHPLKSLT